MTKDPAAEPPITAEEGDMAKAFQELAEGERTAAALESQLSAMEERIEALLARAEKEQQDVKSMKSEDTQAGKSA